jgi:hypothetical protein
MKNLQEKILGILRPSWAYLANPVYKTEQAAKEIATLIEKDYVEKEFCEFLQTKCEGFNKGWRYYKTNDYEKGFMDFDSTDGLHEYWLKEVKGK